MIPMISCEKEKEEEILQTGTLNNTHSSDDSSQKEHNAIWNGQYYLLEFDTAFAKLSDTGGSIAAGTGPCTLLFRSGFVDKNTNQRFVITVGVGWVYWSDMNHVVYYGEEAQDDLDGAVDFMDQKFHHGIGIKLGFSLTNSYGNVLDDLTNLTISVDSFHTYYLGIDKWADYHLVIQSNEMEMDLNGKLRAQG